MSKRAIRNLWLVTGVVAAILLVATVYLSREARIKEEAGYSATIMGLNSVIYLRQQPDPTSHIVTILELGQQVFVTEISEDSAIPWAKIRTGEFEGWVPAERIAEGPS